MIKLQMNMNMLTGNKGSFGSDLQLIYEKYLTLTDGRTTNVLAHLDAQ